MCTKKNDNCKDRKIVKIVHLHAERMTARPKSGHRKLGAVIAVFLFSILTHFQVGAALDLPDDIKADQYLLEAKKALGKGDKAAAMRLFEKIQSLRVEPPVEFLYFYGKVLVEHGAESDDLKKVRKGAELLKQFVINVGKSSEHYISTLELLSGAESRITEISRRLKQEQKRKEEIRKCKEKAREEAKRKRVLLRPGKVFRDCPDCPEMVVILAGSFMMGSPEHEADRDDSEGPRRCVVLDKPFAVGKYEVTFDEWDACVNNRGCRGYRPKDYWGRGRRPVININWDDAQAYVRWLSRKTGKKYRLLSEAEWEYAARGGAHTSRYWGDDVSRQCAHANGDTFRRWVGCRDRFDEQTAPVGSFAANPFDLHDVLGNVWEWVEDCWNGSYAGAPLDGSAWTNGDCARGRVVRGGSWDDKPDLLRSANRIRYGTLGGRDADIGLRVARTLDP